MKTAASVPTRWRPWITYSPPGMCAGFPAGNRDAHPLINRSEQPVVYLEIGSRIDGDGCFYPDDDLMWIDLEDGWRGAHKDGTAY